MVLRVGLLSGATMLITQRLLTRIPITVDFRAWYAGATMVVMLLIMGLALWSFNAATRPQARMGDARSGRDLRRMPESSH